MDTTDIRYRHVLLPLLLGAVLNLTGCLSPQDSPAPDTSAPDAERPDIVQISAGAGHALALLSDSTVVSWGRGGELAEARGAMPSEPTWVPRRVQGLPPICKVEAAPAAWAMALACNGTVWTWGSPITPVNGDLGRLGASDQNNHGSVPGQINRLDGIKDIATASNAGFAVDSVGRGFSWGAGRYLTRSGTEDGYDGFPVPGEMQGIPTLKKVIAAGGTRLIVADDESTWTWGVNRSGSLGRRTHMDESGSVMTSDPNPAQVSIPGGISNLDVSDTHGLALLENGALWGWGQNKFGELLQLPNSDQGAIFVPPLRLNDMSDNFAQVSAGSSFSVAMKDNGSVYAWGANYDGQLGRTPVPERPLRNDREIAHPVAKIVRELPPSVQVDAGGAFALALGKNGSIYSWGSNYEGGLGHPARFENNVGTPKPGVVRLDSAFVRR